MSNLSFFPVNVKVHNLEFLCSVVHHTVIDSEFFRNTTF